MNAREAEERTRRVINRDVADRINAAIEEGGFSARCTIDEREVSRVAEELRGAGFRVTVNGTCVNISWYLGPPDSYRLDSR